MKNFIVFLMALVIFLSLKVEAQLKPAQSQYLVEKGVLINPSFEQGYQGWDISGGCSKSLVTVTPYLNKTLRLTCVAATFSVKQLSTSLVSFAGQQAAFDLQVKADANGVKVSSISNSIRNTEYSVITDTTFKRFKQIGVVANATNNGVEIYSDTAFTGIVDIDNAYLGLSNLTQEISGAHFVGKVSLSDTSCIWSASQSSYGKTSVDNDCYSSATLNGSVSGTIDNTAGIRILNPRLDGKYEVLFNGVLYNAAGAGSCYWKFSKTAAENQLTSAVSAESTNARMQSTLTADIQFELGDSGDVFIVTRSSTGQDCRVYGGGNNWDATISVHFFPDSKSTIATQDVELTAKTANTLSASIDNNGAASITTKDYDFIQSVNRSSLGKVDVVFKSDIITVIPSIEGEMINPGGANRSVYITSLTTSGFTLNYRNENSSSFEDKPFSFTLTKQGADVNKTQTVVGDFEQIEEITGDLTAATANSINIATTSTAITSTDFGSISDYTFTRSSVGQYCLDYSSLGLVEVPVVNAFARHHAGVDPAAKTAFGAAPTKTESCILVTNTAPTYFDPSVIHWNINKQGADVNKSFKGAVINASKAVTRCQTKYLSANVSSSGDIADLTFSNLVIGKKYTVFLQAASGTNSLVQVLHDSITRGAVYSNGDAEQRASTLAMFIASSSAVTISKNNTVVTYGTGNESQTYARLCELPDTTIFTLEFN